MQKYKNKILLDSNIINSLKPVKNNLSAPNNNPENN